MKYALLDTNFILSCIRKKIDFFEEIELMGFKVIIPKEVIREIKKFKDKKSEASLALKIIENNSHIEIELGRGYVDKRIIDYAKENPSLIVATLDKEIKDKVKNQKLVIKGNILEVV